MRQFAESERVRNAKLMTNENSIRAAARSENRMPFSSSPIVGTIAMQPTPTLAAGGRCRLADDSSLASLLASLAHCTSLKLVDGQSGSLVASTRLSRFAPASPDGYDAIRADVTRLRDELEQEYELVGQR
jgi:hypothetical protein